jgi:hypothetical protein
MLAFMPYHADERKTETVHFKVSNYELHQVCVEKHLSCNSLQRNITTEIMNLDMAKMEM